MGLRFRRSIKFLPGVRMNLSGSGVSWSVGRRGATVSLGKRGTFLNLSFGGGFGYRERVFGSRRRLAAVPAAALRPRARVVPWHASRNVAAVLAILLGTLGVHKFYLGRLTGIVYMLFAGTGLSTLVSVIEGLWYFSMTDDEFARRMDVVVTSSTVARASYVTSTANLTRSAKPPLDGSVAALVHSPWRSVQFASVPQDARVVAAKLTRLYDMHRQGIISDQELRDGEMRLLATSRNLTEKG